MNCAASAAVIAIWHGSTPRGGGQRDERPTDNPDNEGLPQMTGRLATWAQIMGMELDARQVERKLKELRENLAAIPPHQLDQITPHTDRVIAQLMLVQAWTQMIVDDPCCAKT
jgi:hypothetical protein